MSEVTLHPLVADYLQRLRRAARTLPRDTRHELCADIEAHLSEETDADSSDWQVLNVLDRLGDPAEIVEAQQQGSPRAADGRHTREWWAIILLLFGGFVFGFGWLVGLVLLWSSPVWTTRDKWIGTLVLPGGLAFVAVGLLPALVVLGSTSSGGCESLTGRPQCAAGPSTGPDVLVIALLVVAVLAPFATAVYLGRRLR